MPDVAGGEDSGIPEEIAYETKSFNTRGMDIVSMHSLRHRVLRLDAFENLLNFQLSKISDQADRWVDPRRQLMRLN